MRDEYIKAFPKLKHDKYFKLTSKQDIKYNCIAWAALYDDRWMWPPGGYTLDGVTYIWPKHVDKNDKLETFIEVFNELGYEVCQDAKYEDGYRKIALYQQDNGNCTHASRQRSNGLWTSKLGKEHDIEHGTPESIEGDIYGKVACIMKKKTK